MAGAVLFLDDQAVQHCLHVFPVLSQILTAKFCLLVDVTEEEPEDEKQECIVCRVAAETEEDGEETESFIPVEDETLAQKLVDIFNNQMAEDEKEDE